MSETPEKRIQRLENQVKALTATLRMTIVTQIAVLETTEHPQLAQRMESHLQALNSLK